MIDWLVFLVASVVFVLLCFLGAVGVKKLIDWWRHEGVGLAYPRKGSYGGYFYEFHPAVHGTPMVYYQHTLGHILPHVIQEKQDLFESGIYFCDLILDETYAGTLSVSRFKHPIEQDLDNPRDRIDVTEVLDDDDHLSISV